MSETSKVLVGAYPPEHAPGPEFIPNPRNIMDVHFKFNGTDGVSLVAGTLDQTLQARGCTIHKCSGDVRSGERGLHIPNLSYQTDEIAALTNAVFSPKAKDAQTEEALLTKIRAMAQPIQQEIEAYIRHNNVGTTIIRNLFSLPLNMPATVAMFNILKDPTFANVKFVLRIPLRRVALE